ncbi:site-specific DNA-methyltransferase [Nocardioides sp. GY 10127]|uniref:site-specific DNA-methyltransferase n=1 Tax=Nocardioides sp. GY 10127 TaxID=2569762 RepID=UPI0010A8E5CF|nr:site-specific DNA-methyltransferase [Nocardioides sp. GY 10127]TIC85595.1 site-specific DNA-methyltransferase [Nocardioides sp. GY 10127]
MTEEIHEIPSATPDLQTELARRLRELAPEAITDGKVDVAKLTELLAADVADSSERFGLFWPGKKRALRAAQEPTTATLRPVKDESKDWDSTKNVFIEGDNLEVLKILQKHYHGKVDLIYIDPPYNTGGDFVYPDNFKEGLATYLEWTKQVNEDGKKVSTNSESEGRYHSNWLNMMYPRLKLARNLLTESGLIFISIDDHELDNLRKLGNEVFGERNFVGLVTRATGTPTGGGFDGFSNAVDYMVVYRRSDLAVLRGLAFGDSDAAIYNERDERGNYLTRSLRRTGGEDRREDRPSMYFGVEAPDGTEVFPIGPGGYESRWICGQDKFKQMVAEGLVEWKLVDRGNGKEYHPYQKFYLEGREKRPSNLWTDVDGNKKGTRELRQIFDSEKVFDSPKPVGLLQRVLQIGADKDALILDFFAGSASTAHAVLKQNAEDGGSRRFIQVQLPEPTPADSAARRLGFDTIAQISRRRIDLAGTELAQTAQPTLGAPAGLDTGFRAYRLGDTNFSKWRVASNIEPNELEQHLLSLRDSAEDEATADALLSELLLKQGYSLTEESVEQDIAGLPLQSVGGGLLLAYLDEHTKPSLDQLRAVVDEEPARFVILEDAFHGDDELKTNLAQLCKSKGVELWSA